MGVSKCLSAFCHMGKGSTGGALRNVAARLVCCAAWEGAHPNLPWVPKKCPIRALGSADSSFTKDI